MRLSILASPVLACLGLALGAASPASATAPSPVRPSRPTVGAATAAAINASNDFDFAMYAKLPKTNGNVFFSAPSLRGALGIAYLGARGVTKDEMARALVLDPDVAKSAASAKLENDSWRDARGNATLSIANRLWVDGSGFTLNPAFAKSANDAYGAAAQTVDFRGAAEPSRGLVNQWVGSETHGKIPELLAKGSVDASTRMVITNAIYFKGTWASAFDKKATTPLPFFASGITKKDVATMRKTSTFKVARSNGASILELPYANSDLALDVVLPDEKGANALASLEASLSATRFTEWTSKLYPQEAEVELPKFTFTWGGSMTKPLNDLGMKAAFDGARADFSGIATSRPGAAVPLVVSDVVHKAFVAVDEEGTEAAAATAVIMVEATTAVKPPPTPFKVDRPFLFAIRDTKTGGVLFMGRVTNPA